MISDRASKIARMRAERRPWRRIAADLKVALSTVHKHGTRAGAPHREARDLSRNADERALEALALHRRDFTVEDIGRRMGGIKRRRVFYLLERGRRVEERRRRSGLL